MRIDFGCFFVSKPVLLLGCAHGATGSVRLQRVSHFFFFVFCVPLWVVLFWCVSVFVVRVVCFACCECVCVCVSGVSGVFAGCVASVFVFSNESDLEMRLLAVLFVFVWLSVCVCVFVFVRVARFMFCQHYTLFMVFYPTDELARFCD